MLDDPNATTESQFTALLDYLAEEERIGMETDTELGTILLNNADEFRTAVKEGRVKELAAEMTAELDAQDGVPMAGSVADVCAQLGTDITD